MTATHMGDDELLASLGYKQGWTEFKRTFTVLEIIGLGVSIVSLIPSIASVIVYALPSGGGPALVWGWMTCVIFITTIALSLGELSSSMPTSGGLYYWTYKYSSPSCRTLLCWVVGYINTITDIAVMASGDWATAVQISALISIASSNDVNLTTPQIYGVFSALLICHASLCSMGTRFIARIQTYCMAIHILLCFAVIIGMPIATPRKSMNTAKFALWEFTNLNGWSNGYAFILSFLAPLWTVGGFDAALHISEEATNANIAVPWSIVSSCISAAIVGLGVNITLAFCMGTDVQGILASPIDQPLATIFFNSFGQKGTLVLWSFIVLTQFITALTYLTAASRQTFAFARDGALPFSRLIYRINPRTKVPVIAVWFTAIFALLLGSLAFAGSAAIGAMFSLAVIGQYAAYSIPIAARYLGGQKFTPGPFNLGKFSLPVAFVAIMWMLFMSIVFLFPTSPHPNGRNMNYATVVFGGVIMFSVAYFFFPKYGGIHWFKGPVGNIIVKDEASADKSEEAANGQESPRFTGDGLISRSSQ